MRRLLGIILLVLLSNILLVNNAVAIPKEEDVSYKYWMHIKTIDKKLSPKQDLEYLNSLIPEDETDLITTCERRVDLYMMLNSPKSALNFLDKAYNRFQSKSKKTEILELKKNIYFKIKDYKNAYEICCLLESSNGLEKIFKSPEAPLTLRVHAMEQSIRFNKMKYWSCCANEYLLLAKVISRASAENSYFVEDNITKQEKLADLKSNYINEVKDEKCRMFCNVLFEYATGDRAKALNKLYKLRKDYLSTIQPMYKTMTERTIDNFITSSIRYVDPNVGIVTTNDDLKIYIK